MSESRRRNLFLILCAIALLHTGVHICQSFVNYPNWHLIDARSFPAYHWGITIRAGIHRQLDLQSNTPELLSRLMATDWIRNSLEFTRTALYVWGLSLLVNLSERIEEHERP